MYRQEELARRIRKIDDAFGGVQVRQAAFVYNGLLIQLGLSSFCKRIFLEMASTLMIISVKGQGTSARYSYNRKPLEI
jgi:hypothetical protein